MLIRNVFVYTICKTFVPGAVRIARDTIRHVEFVSSLKESAVIPPLPGEEVLDGNGGLLFPGMIDIHFHGCMDADFSDGLPDLIKRIADYEASVGVTSIAPSTMTLPVEELLYIFHSAAAFKRKQDAGEDPEGAHLIGINMEGPFISPQKCGAQDARFVIPRDSGVFSVLQKAAEGLIRTVAIAPEEKGEAVDDFIRRIGPGARAAIGHSNADYNTVRWAIEAGASHAVHLYNAMNPFHQREPGVIGAFFDSDGTTAELIADGIHVHPAAIRIALRMLGPDRIIFVSDTMRAAGMGDGNYSLGDKLVEVKGKEARLVNGGAHAGSVMTLPDCVRNAVRKMQIPLETAIACASVNPAKAMGVFDRTGSVEAGKQADLVIWDREMNLKHVLVSGMLLDKN